MTAFSDNMRHPRGAEYHSEALKKYHQKMVIIATVSGILPLCEGRRRQLHFLYNSTLSGKNLSSPLQEEINAAVTTLMPIRQMSLSREASLFNGG